MRSQRLDLRPRLQFAASDVARRVIDAEILLKTDRQGIFDREESSPRKEVTLARSSRALFRFGFSKTAEKNRDSP